MKLTAHDLCIIQDTILHSMCIANWRGFYTDEARERVRDKIGEILAALNVELITEEATFALDADTGL